MMKQLSERPRNRPSSTDPLQCYLNEISKIPLLTIDEEKELGFRAQRGEEVAIQKLVSSNLRFVVMVAKKYRTFGVPFLDLINEGNVGLIEAAKRFDPERNIRFISYAIWWIRQSMLDLVSKMGHLLRLPVKINNALYKIHCATSKLTANSNREPTHEEIAESTGISPDDVLDLITLAGKGISLDQPIGHDQRTVKNLIPYTKTVEAHDNLMQNAMHKNLRTVLTESLKDKEREVLVFRFGLKDGKCHTLKQIGQKMGISRERVRQIQERALAKLRSNQKTRILFGNCLTGAA
jgi:RNA polymerase primary sigma factor